MTPPLELPTYRADARRDCAWSSATDGETGAEVFRLAAVNRPSLYVKSGVGTIAADIAADHARLQWLALRIAVPAVRHSDQRDGTCTLVTTPLDGRSASTRASWTPRTLTTSVQGAYGIKMPDERRTVFHLALDELF